MAIPASSVEIAAMVGVMSWPFAAGLGVVLWSKARAAQRRRQMAALDGDLRGLFRTVEERPLPDRLALVVEALEEAEALRPTTKVKRAETV